MVGLRNDTRVHFTFEEWMFKVYGYEEAGDHAAGQDVDRRLRPAAPRAEAGVGGPRSQRVALRDPERDRVTPDPTD